jgi:hypothetical protein
VQDIVVGILAIVIGGLFCFRGYLAMRVIIPIWGAFAGFFFGASLITTFTDEAFLRNVAGWLLGLVFALLFGAIAYLYYEVSVVVVMASIGFTLGVTAMVALDVTWSWAIILVGVSAAVGLAFLAIAADLPTGLLLILTALTGASAVVLGIMLLVGTAETAAFRTEVIIGEIEDRWWWWAIYAGIAIAGIVTQIRMVESLRSSLREGWAESGGRELRRQ